MRPSSFLCLAQEIVQRERAASTTFPNVRAQAEQAADAWSREALWAERREKRQDQTRAKADRLRDNERGSHENPDRSLSENPDRGMADA